jgi:hypothetical protein
MDAVKGNGLGTEVLDDSLIVGIVWRFLGISEWDVFWGVLITIQVF